MPGWKRDVGRRLDALIARTVPGVAKAVKWNSPFYGVEDEASGSSAFIASRSTSRWRSSAARRCVRPARPVQAKRRALPRHPRGRPARRSPARRLGEASEPTARRTDVSIVGWVSAESVTQHPVMPGGVGLRPSARRFLLARPFPMVILGLVPRIQPSTSAGASGSMDSRAKPDHDNPVPSDRFAAASRTPCVGLRADERCRAPRRWWPR